MNWPREKNKYIYLEEMTLHTLLKSTVMMVTVMVKLVTVMVVIVMVKLVTVIVVTVMMNGVKQERVNIIILVMMKIIMKMLKTLLMKTMRLTSERSSMEWTLTEMATFLLRKL